MNLSAGVIFFCPGPGGGTTGVGTGGIPGGMPPFIPIPGIPGTPSIPGAAAPGIPGTAPGIPGTAPGIPGTAPGIPGVAPGLKFKTKRRNN